MHGSRVNRPHSSMLTLSGTRLKSSTLQRLPSLIAGSAPITSQMDILKGESHVGDHFLTNKQLELVYRSNIHSGLKETFAAELLESNGPNVLLELHGTSMWKIFRSNLFGWFQCILWAGAILNFIAYFGSSYLDVGEDHGGHSTKEYLYLGTVITFTILGTGLFGFYQEAKNIAVMSGFEKLVPPDAVVIRESKRKVIPNTELVVGDIVEMKSGDIVPADIRILTCTNFTTDKSSLTGESEPVRHRPECTNSNPLESKNMLYFGCPVLDGVAKGMVVATGEKTQIGRIAGLVTGLEKEKTPIAKEITYFVKIICGVAFFFGAIFFFMVYIIQKSWLTALQYMLGIILANVPEGLLVTLTVCMTLSAKALKSKNCLAKTLQAVETLGSTSCICSDKTGTMTQNRMSVSHLYSNYEILDWKNYVHVSDSTYATLCLAASLNLKAEFSDDAMNESIDKRKIIGDASESAILRYMEAHRSATKIRKDNPKAAEIPFSSAFKYQVTIHRMQATQSYYLIMKGAPEIILEYCSKVHTNDGLTPITPMIKKELKTHLMKMANMGERVIGYCDLRLPPEAYPIGYPFDTLERNFPLEDLHFIGAISLIDPPRHNIAKSIALCKQAGIRVVMVTGDHPVTALAISRQCGTITLPTAYDYAFEHHIEIADIPQHVINMFSAAVITGEELRKMSIHDLKEAQNKYSEITFARTSPQQKLFIVETFQSSKHVVAVTGDGVNDSPALKKADIGIAMGIAGTEVSKKAADMILLDDNFASIVLGVQEGRRIFDNLKKTIAYTLTSNTPEMLPFVLYACVGMPLPMTLMLILVINVGTDLLPAMSLAYEDSEEDIMSHPPRKPTDHLVNHALIFIAYFQVGLIQFFGGLYSYFVVFARDGFFPSSLMFVRKEWESNKLLVTDSLGREWNFIDRKKIERKAQTAYFVAFNPTMPTHGGQGGRVNRRRSSMMSLSVTRIHSSTLQRLPSLIVGSAPVSSRMDVLKEENHTGDHFLTPTQLEVVYRSNVNTGLTESFAAELLETHGPNALVELHGTSMWKVFRHNLFGWFQCVLWAGAILNFIAYFGSSYIDSGHEEGGHTAKEYLYLGTVITFTIVGTGLFGFYQEAKNIAVMSGFEKLVPPNAVVIRESIKKVIPNVDLVIGDIVEMKGGDIVPADTRILTCSNFNTDMSSLTGESEPIKHRPECTHSNPLESKNMVYFGCPIIEGTAKGMVVATGENTQMGRIAGLVTGLQKEETPIAKEITHFIKLICSVAFVFGVIFFLMVYFIQGSWLSALQYMLGIILANVPEGLIVTLTVCMTLSAKALKAKNCLAKTLQAVETLGSTSCICSDKTGTLTENQMTVSHLYCNFEILDKNDHTHVSNPTYATLCLAASLNLKAEFTHDTMNEPIEKRKILGDASESAILRYMEANRSATQVRNENPRAAEIPFSSAYKYQVTIHSMQATKSYYLIMKGAPEIVLEYCSRLHTDNDLQQLTPIIKKELKAHFIKMANMGERVIGYCDLKLPQESYPIGYAFDTQKRNFPVEDLNFIGAISMIDPPRKNVAQSIALCRQAGIKVVMVTGDHPVTALAISRQCGTITLPTAYDYAFEHHIELADVPHHVKNMFAAAVITGDELRKMSVNDLKAAQKKYAEITFARTSPQQKLFIVETFQSLKHVVAVTGDGVNDSPALKKADIGIAMGIAGTEVSKKAADMILLDDNFASIVLGVQEGRRIFDNLKKTIAYTLTSNTPEMLPFVLYACVGMPLPMTLMLILVINVGTDLLPAMSLAYEDSEEDIMSHPPRKATDHLVNKVLIFMAYFQVGLIQFFAGLYAYFVVFAQDGFFPSSLMFIRKEWEAHKSLVKDTLGREWAFKDRKRVERKAQTAYFVAVCWTQISDVIICKTRRISLMKKGMRNQVLNLSILIDLIAAAIVTYVPLCHEVFSTEPLSWHDFISAWPFMFLMICGDELRRYLIRNNISQWVEAETYY
ncbi:unnamed protein product [Arctia plantaginis]|uniref:Na(+)/K(+)-exchanging ATPase n=1 Tax=Arctia plantaginis TaxID=874455 RepID=A0A8S1B6U2_ARCPL|nr:unnamed protein product [Arctia plantaginis]